MSNTLTPEDIAEHFGRNVSFVKAQAREGKWPHLRVGKLVRFTPAHLAQIEAMCEVPIQTTEPVPAAQAWGRVGRGAR